MAVWLNLIPQLHQPGDEDVSMRHHHFHERGEHYYSGAFIGFRHISCINGNMPQSVLLKTE